MTDGIDSVTKRTQRTVRRLYLTAMLMATIGCAGESASSTSDVVAAWSLDSLEHLRIAGIHGRDSLIPFGDIKGVSRASDSTIVVADARDSLLHFFNVERGFVRTVEASGDSTRRAGITGFMRCGDSLYVRDGARQQFIILSTLGTPIRTVSLPTDSAGGVAAESACAADGTVLNASNQPFMLPYVNEAIRLEAHYWLTTPAAARRADIGRRARSEMWFTRSGAEGEIFPLPLGRFTSMALGRSRAYIGTADSLFIEVYGHDGKPETPLVWAGVRQSATPEDIERYKQRDTAGLGPAESLDRTQRWTSMQVNKTLPAYTALVVDSADNLWVRAQPPANDEWVPWTIFSPQGRIVARAMTPQSLRVWEIGSDWVLGVAVDPATRVSVVKSFTLRRKP